MDRDVATQEDEYIIVAEDSAPNRTILVLLLKKLGYRVLECENGDLAWSYMTENREQRIVAVVSDLMMPKMDGLEFLRRVRNDDQYKSLPFVLATAVSEKDYISEAKKMDVNGYILKPVTYNRVLTKLQDLFPQKTFPRLVG